MAAPMNSTSATRSRFTLETQKANQVLIDVFGETGKRKMRRLSGRPREKLMSIKIQTNFHARNEF